MIIGIMGYSGSGKSTLSEEFKKLGAYVIDADKIGKDILSPEGDALKRVVDAFGEDILFSDKSLNRKKLGEIVFKDKKSLDILNGITWEAINEEIIKRAKSSTERIIIIDCPLLYKVSAYDLCNEVIFIDTPDSVMIDRIMKRDGICFDTAVARINSQKDENFKNYATIIIENTDMASLTKKAAELMKGWLK